MNSTKAGTSFHFGVISAPFPSHVAGFISVARELRLLGHSITFFNLPHMESSVRSQGFEFYGIGRTGRIVSLEDFMKTVGEWKGVQAVRFALQQSVLEAEAMLEEVPKQVKERGIHALLVDRIEMAGSSIAEHCQIPFITICTGVPESHNPDIPPIMTTWPYKPSPLFRWRNRLAGEAIRLVLRPLLNTVNRFRSQWGLPSIKNVPETFSPLAEISQLTSYLDFPDSTLPPHFHYIGLFEKHDSRPVYFPFERLNSKPLVYAAFGTLLKNLHRIYGFVAEACDRLDVQLVITLGSEKGVERDIGKLPGTPIVVGFAPQLDLLKRAAVTVCHGGANTTLESFVCGTPVIIIPNSNDGSGMAARVARSGAGEMIQNRHLSAARVQRCLERILQNPSYRERATAIRESILAAGGSERAAKIIVSALDRTNDPTDSA